MATTRHGILGAFNGRVGNVIGSNWRGRNVIRIRPASVSNPRTELQMAQRSRFGMMTRFLSSQRMLVNIGFRPNANGQSAFNAASSYNLLNAFNSENPELQIDYCKVMLSLGLLPPPEDLAVASSLAGTLSLAWADNSSDELASGADALMLGVFDPATATALTFPNCAIRSASAAEISLPARWAGRTVEVFAFFLSPKGMSVANSKDMVSDTIYGGTIELL
jgi:hypothetical protein